MAETTFTLHLEGPFEWCEISERLGSFVVVDKAKVRSPIMLRHFQDGGILQGESSDLSWYQTGRLEEYLYYQIATGKGGD